MTGTTLRLAVSGTYSTGKTTTTEALSVATGIPRTHAMTSREILQDLVPGKQVQELSASELTALGLRRLEERIQHEEEQPGSFIADGSVIHEWIYGVARMQVGINPGAGLAVRTVKGILGMPCSAVHRCGALVDDQFLVEHALHEAARSGDVGARPPASPAAPEYQAGSRAAREAWTGPGGRVTRGPGLPG